MDFPRALTQIAEIHQQIAKGEIYRGYRSLPIAASGLVGVAAALAAAGAAVGDPIAFVWYWTVVAAVAGAGRRQRDRLQLCRPRAGVGPAPHPHGARPVPARHARRRGADRELRALEPAAACPAAGGVGDLFRHRHVLLAPVPAARRAAWSRCSTSRSGRCCCGARAGRAAERVARRRDVRRRPADGGDGACTGNSKGATP